MVHVPLAVFREEVDPADSPFDVTLHQFLEKKRSRSQSVLAPSSSGKGDQEFIESFLGRRRIDSGRALRLSLMCKSTKSPLLTKGFRILDFQVVNNGK